MKITNAMVKEARLAAQNVNATDVEVRAMLEAALGRAMKPRKPRVHKAPRRNDLQITSVIPDLRDGTVIIIPVPEGKDRSRMQANLKGIQCKPDVVEKGTLNLKTEQVVYFSVANPENGLYRAIKIEVEKRKTS